MTVGNLIALRQTNIVRMLAYSGVAQAGFMLAPLAVVGRTRVGAGQAVITYLLIYAAMNLGAFAVVLAVARKTRCAEISSWGGLFEYAPGLTVPMTMFLFSLAGIPPLGGWFAKFVVFRAAARARRHGRGRHARRRRRRQLGDRALLLRQRRQGDVDGAGRPTATGRRSGSRSPSAPPSPSPSILTVAFGVSNLATRFGDLALFVPDVTGVRPADRPCATCIAGLAVAARQSRRAPSGPGRCCRRCPSSRRGRRRRRCWAAVVVGAARRCRRRCRRRRRCRGRCCCRRRRCRRRRCRVAAVAVVVLAVSSPTTTPSSVRMSVSSASSRTRTRSRTWPSSISTFTCTRCAGAEVELDLAAGALLDLDRQPLAGVAADETEARRPRRRRSRCRRRRRRASGHRRRGSGRRRPSSTWCRRPSCCCRRRAVWWSRRRQRTGALRVGGVLGFVAVAADVVGGVVAGAGQLEHGRGGAASSAALWNWRFGSNSRPATTCSARSASEARSTCRGSDGSKSGIATEKMCMSKWRGLCCPRA